MGYGAIFSIVLDFFCARLSANLGLDCSEGLSAVLWGKVP